MSLLARLPDHVTAVEECLAGTRYHGFRKISQRDEWVAEDPEHRKPCYAHCIEVLKAWDAFSIVLHADPRAQRRIWFP